METPRPLNKIAAEILTLWSSVILDPKKSRPGYAIYAMPYVQAMLSLSTINDQYGLDSGESVVRYLLSNLAQWRGPDAARIKHELNQHLKEKVN